jgi:hypothetical protein
VAFPDSWREQITFMRDEGVTHATWTVNGDSLMLVSAILGPKPSPSQPTMTQKKPQTEEERREAHRRVLLASSSRLVPVSREPKT